MSNIQGTTVDHVEAAVLAELKRQGLSCLPEETGLEVRPIALAALRALIEEDGRFAVPVELLVLGGCEPCSIQRVLDQTIGAALHYEAVQTNSVPPPRMRK